MEMKRFTAWRFFNSTVEMNNDNDSGLRISNKGGIATVSEHESIRQAILLLLATSPGERIMRPKYGCELNRLMFAPNNDTTAGLAIHYVKQAVRRWEPRIIVSKVDAYREEENESELHITLNYRVRTSQKEDNLLYRINLRGRG